MGRKRFRVKVEPVVEKDFYYELFYEYNLGKFWMICPFVIKGCVGGREIITYGLKDMFYYVECLFFSCFVVFSFIWEKVVPLEHIRAFFNIFTSIICIVFSFVLRHRTVKTLRLFEELDRMVLKCGIPLSYGRSRVLSLMKLIPSIIIHSIMIVIVLFFDVYPIDQVFIVFSMIGSNIVTKLYLDQFIRFVFILRERLRIINEYLTGDIRLSPRKLDDIFACYDMIWKLTRIINFNYGVPLLFGIGAAFFSSTSYIYTWLKFEKLLIPQFLFLLSQIFFLIHLPNICQMCVEQAEDLIMIIHKIFYYNKNCRTENLLKFSIKLIHRRIEFYVCSLFPLDRKFIFNVMAGMTIYIIIFIQMNVNAKISA